MMEGVNQSVGTWDFQRGPTSLSYKGEFILSTNDGPKKRVKHGTGILRWQDGRQYQGQFAFDRLHGEGIFVWPNGDKYVGQYCDDYKSGFGTLTLADGCRFKGNWHKGKRHGDFLYMDPNLGAFRQEYRDDELLDTQSISSFDDWIFQKGYHCFAKSDTSGDAKNDEPICCICLGELCQEEICCQLACKHVFHKECIDNWTQRKNHCPLCVQEIPLPKLVPRRPTKSRAAIPEELGALSTKGTKAAHEFSSQSSQGSSSSADMLESHTCAL